jgi:hypothetical protein
MKTYLWLLVGALAAPVTGFAANGTITGSEDELRRLLEIERAIPAETIHLSASATATLTPKSAVIRASIEVEAKTIAELLKLTAEKKTALQTALTGLNPVYAETFADPSEAIEIAKLKRLALRTDFKVPLSNLADGDRVMNALGSIANVTITDVELIFDPAADLGSKLLDSAVADLGRQKAFYEAAFNVELRLKSFVPFTAAEKGGGDDLPSDQEMVVLSPFEVTGTSRFLRLRSKNRTDDVVVHKFFESRQVVKQISAVYEMRAK